MIHVLSGSSTSAALHVYKAGYSSSWYGGSKWKTLPLTLYNRIGFSYITMHTHTHTHTHLHSICTAVMSGSYVQAQCTRDVAQSVEHLPSTQYSTPPTGTGTQPTQLHTNHKTITSYTAKYSTCTISSNLNIYHSVCDGTYGVILRIEKAGCHPVAIAQVVEH